MGATAIKRQYGLAEAKDKLSALTASANATGSPFVIMKNNKPWVEVRPLAAQPRVEGEVTITPVRRRLSIPDLDELFSGYAGGFEPREDGFASAVGSEAM